MTAILRRARWAKLNENELELLAPGGGDINSRVRALQEASDLELVIVTLGAEGALALDRDGKHSRRRVAPERSLRLVDTVGAGDAFSAVTLLGLLEGWDLDTTLRRAQVFAGAVVGIRGATPENHDFYAPFIGSWS